MSKLDLTKEFAGRRALITGGTRGIGAAIAHRILEAGGAVAVIGRSPTTEAPKAASFVQGDLTTAAGVREAAAQGLAALGGLDILINNAGGSKAFTGGSDSIPDDEWQYDIALNLLAAVRTTNALLPALRQSVAASIINISSTAATTPFPSGVHYGAAKAALNYYSRTLAVELGGEGIRVNVVTPGPISTLNADALREQLPIKGDEWNKFVPLGHIGAPEDVVEIVTLLASSRGKFLTGGNYHVDGGMAAL